ncbi:hypothetical protein PGT21_027843 [Puccinia graminis f. sp. tritici]|uniref:Uncharacterized protein n=1 Tax=Puccinia graminis f. sp. tritici TaxID=56615 RepID=A0A5B0NVI5_PUCGR|nr:hypothetical protein PGT21_027843 [Puccinia graminis f. sp. tritici]
MDYDPLLFIGHSIGRFPNAIALMIGSFWWFCLIPKVEQIKQQKTSNRRAFIPKLQFSFIWVPFISDPGRKRFCQARPFQGNQRGTRTILTDIWGLEGWECFLGLFPCCKNTVEFIVGVVREFCIPGIGLTGVSSTWNTGIQILDIFQVQGAGIQIRRKYWGEIFY